ncbi:MAG: hypothetical protein LBL43_03125, partial [Treponema sp.]|nr:hypothetical protein [Treponema sp.]
MQGLLDYSLTPARGRNGPPETAAGGTATALGGSGASVTVFVLGGNPIKYTDPTGKAAQRDNAQDKGQLFWENISPAIEKIQNTKFGQTQEGKQIVNVLKYLKETDSFTVTDLPEGFIASTEKDSMGNISIFIDIDVSVKRLAGRLVHEAAHVLSIMNKQNNSLDEEKQAFKNAYAVDKELKVPLWERNSPSDKKLESRYPQLKWKTNE